MYLFKDRKKDRGEVLAPGAWKFRKSTLCLFCLFLSGDSISSVLHLVSGGEAFFKSLELLVIGIPGPIVWGLSGPGYLAWGST